MDITKVNTIPPPLLSVCNKGIHQIVIAMESDKVQQEFSSSVLAICCNRRLLIAFPCPAIILGGGGVL